MRINLTNVSCRLLIVNVKFMKNYMISCKILTKFLK